MASSAPVTSTASAAAAVTKGKTIFVTGATGHIGSTVAKLAIADGYTVRGLSRSEKGDAILKDIGVAPVRGDLETVDVLLRESATADIVMHLADSLLDHANPKTYDEYVRIDAGAVEAMAEGLKGTNKPLVISSGVLVVAPDPEGNETNEESPLDENPFVERMRVERHSVAHIEKDVKVIVIRLAPWVYGYGRSGIFLFMSAAFKNKQAVYIDGGNQGTAAVHVDDAARLYLLAAEKAKVKAGSVFNATSDTNLTQRQLAEAMAAAVHVPAVSLTKDEAAQKFGPLLSKFLAAETRASSAKAERILGWRPRGPSLMQEFATGSYFDVAQKLMKD